MIDVENAINTYDIGDTKKDDSTSKCINMIISCGPQDCNNLKGSKQIIIMKYINVPTYTHGMIIPYIYLLQRDPYLLTTSEQTALF